MNTVTEALFVLNFDLYVIELIPLIAKLVCYEPQRKIYPPKIYDINIATPIVRIFVKITN